MSKAKLSILFALSGLLLASCGSPDATAAANDAADSEVNALDGASPAGAAQANGSEAPGVESVPPPDAVSHPNGFLPYGNDLPPPSASEPAPADPSGSGETPPATEDQYMRNKQGR